MQWWGPRSEHSKGWAVGVSRDHFQISQRKEEEKQAILKKRKFLGKGLAKIFKCLVVFFSDGGYYIYFMYKITILVHCNLCRHNFKF